MNYQIVTTKSFDKSFKKLDKEIQKPIKAWIDKNLVECENPRLHGKALTANRSGEWRYRIGNYRILAEIKDKELILVFIDVGHRSSIY